MFKRWSTYSLSQQVRAQAKLLSGETNRSQRQKCIVTTLVVFLRLLSAAKLISHNEHAVILRSFPRHWSNSGEANAQRRRASKGRFRHLRPSALDCVAARTERESPAHLCFV
uniref:Uncharacterized protein n=1 Tax=Ixodes ricinus TaxID=34613 RepID=A0A6B0UK17_IXORI